MTTRFCAGVLLSLALVSVSCSESNSTRLASATIDSSGGTIAVDSGDRAGTSLAVPPGAVVNPTAFTIDRTGVTAVPDAVAAGLASTLGPGGAALAQAATLTLTFDPSAVPQGATDADFVVKRRDRDGRIVDVAVTSVDRGASVVTALVTTLGSFWVAVLVNGGELALFEYWPLGVGSRWEYDNQLTIAVRQSAIEPNLPGAVTLLSLVGSGFDEGLYVDRVAGETQVYGRYARFDSFQEIHTTGFVFLPAAGRLGDEIPSQDDYLGYAPLGATVSSWSGTETSVTRILSQGRLVVPFGSFDDVLEVEVETVRTDDRPRTTTNLYRLWLARDLGPVQVEFTGLATTGFLRFAQVVE